MRVAKFLLKKATRFAPEAALRGFGAGHKCQEFVSASRRSCATRNLYCPAGEWDKYRGVPRINFSGASAARDGSKMMVSRLQLGGSAGPEVLNGLLEQGRVDEAVTVVERMAKDAVPITTRVLFSILERCIKQRNITAGRRMHSLVVDRGLDGDASLGKVFIRLFASGGCLLDALRVFRKIAAPKMTTWRAIISACTNQGQGEEAIRLYQEMVQLGVQANDFIYVHVLQACACSGALREGREIHTHIINSGLEPDLYVASTLIDMYAKCGSLCHARQVFDKLPEKNLVVWTAMISGYARQGQGQEALHLFEEMQMHGFLPNKVTFLCILKACASIAALDQGKQVHSQLIGRGLHSDTAIGNTLVDMYAKCGCLDSALLVFNELQERDVVSWTALLGAYAQKGQAELAIHLFQQMQHEGVKPNKVTLLSVLAACSHAGKLEEGSELFESMSKNFGIAPEVEHYSCMVDLLGRAGRLHEAEAFIDAMPLPPDGKIWTSLLWACQTYRNVELGKYCFDSIVQLEPDSTAAYILMSQTYAAAGRFDDAVYVRNRMKHAGVKKVAGRTWIEVHNRVISFQAEDNNHFERRQIFEMLKAFDNAPTQVASRGELLAS